MADLPLLLAFVAAATILTLTPGLDRLLVLRSSPAAYDAVKLLGAVYPVWMGARLLWAPLTALRDAKGSKPAAMSGAFASGLLMNLLNPKVGVFYVSFLPQFVPAGADVAANTFLLVCMHGALSLVWFGILIAAATALSRWLRRPAALTTLDRLTGGVFVGFGVKLAASSAVCVGLGATGEKANAGIWFKACSAASIGLPVSRVPVGPPPRR